MSNNSTKHLSTIPSAVAELRKLRKLLLSTAVPPCFILTICSSLIILWVLAGPYRMKLQGPSSVQLYYSLIAFADLCAVVITGYSILGIPLTIYGISQYYVLLV